MKTLRKAAVVWALVAVGAVAQQADANAPATREDVEKYLAAINSHQMMAQMMDAMAKPMHQMVHDQYLKDKDKLPADFEERTTKMLDDSFRDMPFDQMMQATVPIYQKHLTKGDIDALVAFYSSPTGQKMLRELPAIMGETMQAMMPSMEKYMETVRQKIDEQFAQALKQSEKKSN
jgi:hypothetical protein